MARSIRKVFGRIDLVHAHVVLPSGLVGAHIARSLGIPLLLQEHSAPFEMHLDSPEKRRLVQEVFESAWKVAAVGADLAQRLSTFGASETKLITLPNLVSTDKFNAHPQRLPLEPLRLISVGALIERKGFATILRAVRILQSANVDLRLVIVGDGPLRSELEKLSYSLGLMDLVEFKGHLSRDATAGAMANAHIYVCASQRESFGLAPAEALAVGRPVVTTACGGPEGFVGTEDGVVVSQGDCAALADGIKQVAKRLHAFDPQRLHRRMEERFGPTGFRRRVLAVYRDAQNRNKAFPTSP
jgi:glycosyltransferase involved in cell wall biosynthesis